MKSACVLASQFLYFCPTGFPRGPSAFTSHTSECYPKTGSLGSRSLPNASPAWEGLQVPRRPSDASRCEVRPAARARGRDWRALGPSKGHSNATVPGFYSRGGEGAAGRSGLAGNHGEGARGSGRPRVSPPPCRGPGHLATHRPAARPSHPAAGSLPAEPRSVRCEDTPRHVSPKPLR